MSAKVMEDKILPRRFELIKKMYFSDRVVASSKKDKIIDWFLDQFAENQSKKQSMKYRLLWETFYDILVEENKLSVGSRLLIKSNSVKNLLEAVETFPSTYSWAHVMLSAISTFLQTPTINASLLSDMDALMKFLVGSLKIITEMHLSGNVNVQIFDAGINLMNIVLDLLENLPSANDDCWIPYFTEVLRDISIFVYISSSDKRFENTSDRLTKKIIFCLFNLKSKQFETLFSSDAHDDDLKSANENIVNFLYSLQDGLNSEEIISSISVSLANAFLVKKIVLTFFTQNRSSFQAFKILSLFFAVCGLDIPILLGTTSCCKSLFKRNDKLDVNLLGISYILEACTSFSRYFSSVAELENYVKPSMWLTGVSSALLAAQNSKRKLEWLKCFQCLVNISPAVLETDIVPIIKTALFNLSVRSTESKKQYCELFSAILRLHSQLHQLPRFFVKFILALTECIKEDSGNKFLLNGQLLPDIADSLAQCIQMYPRTQIIDIWNIFIETFSTLEAITKNFMTTKGYIFLVAQIFSTFLLHAQLFQANIPPTVQHQIKELIDKTAAELKQHASVFKETKSLAVPLQRSVLLLSYAIGEVKLAFSAYYDEPIEVNDPATTEHVFDFSVLHKHLDKDISASLESFIDGKDRILSVLVFQLLLQKLKGYQLKVPRDEEKNMTRGTVATILNQLQACQSATGPWDGDLCSVTDKNYGSVMWTMFLKISPVLLSNWSHKEIYLLCNIAYDLLSDKDMSTDGIKTIIMSSFQNEFFRDSKLFQTAFVSVIWRQERLIKPSKKRSHSDSEDSRSVSDRIFSLLNVYHSKGYKYAERTPKSSKNSGSVWEEMKEISDLLNSLLPSESLSKDKLNVEQMSDFLELFKILPLQYLLPGNQMKCVIGLSYLFFLIPQSCTQAEGLSLAKEITLLLTSIFEGPRSVWLFDFVNSGFFIKHVLASLNYVLGGQDDEIEWANNFLGYLVHLILRHPDSIKAFKPYVSKVIDLKDGNKTTLMFFRTLLKKLAQKISRFYKQEANEELLLQMSLETCVIFVEHMQKHFNQSFESYEHHSVINCFTSIIEIICHPGLKDETKMRKKCLKLLSTTLSVGFEKLNILPVENRSSNLIDAYFLFISIICRQHTQISSYLPSDFESSSWHLILSHFEKTALLSNKHAASYRSDSCKDSPAADHKYCAVCFHKYPFLVDFQFKDVKEIVEKESILLSDSTNRCLQELSNIASEEQLRDVFNCVLEKMGCSSSSDLDVFSFRTFLLVFQRLISVNNEKCQKPLLNESVLKCFSFLLDIMSSICQSVLCQVMVSIPVLEFMSFIVQGKKGLPAHVLYQSLHCVVYVLKGPVNDYEFYSRMFITAWDVVYKLFMHQTAAVSASPAPFLAFVSKLLKSIIMAGSAEGLSKCSPEVYQQMLLCAENMNRLLTVISRQKTEFAKLAPYLVVDYVDTVRHITLEPNIKESILSGIFRLLEICSEDSIKMIAVNLSYICQEVFANLIKNYRQNKHSDV